MRELEKIKAAHESSQIIGDFLEWLLNVKQYTIAEYNKNDELYRVRHNIEELLAEYYKIDLKRAEEERRAILDQIRDHKEK